MFMYETAFVISLGTWRHCATGKHPIVPGGRFLFGFIRIRVLVSEGVARAAAAEGAVGVEVPLLLLLFS